MRPCGSGEMTIAEAARRNKASEQSIGRWKSQLLEGGPAGIVDGGETGRPPARQSGWGSLLIRQSGIEDTDGLPGRLAVEV